MRLGILCPMDREAALLARRFRRTHTVRLAGTRAYEGRWLGVECLAMQCGLGKVAAAAGAQALISAGRVRAVVLIGLAGAVHPTLRVGDVVIATHLVQHDLDARPLFEYTLIPDLGIKRLPADPALRRAARDGARVLVRGGLQVRLGRTTVQRFGLARPRVRSGLVLTGDQFIAWRARRRLRRLFPQALCVEMEGASVAQVCRMNRIPCAVIRIVSDRADRDAGLDFSAFLSQAAGRYIAALAEAIVEQMTMSSRKRHHAVMEH